MQSQIEIRESHLGENIIQTDTWHYIVRRDYSAINGLFGLQQELSEFKSVLSKAYEKFTGTLVDNLALGYSADHQKIIIHMFEEEAIDRGIRKLAGDTHIVSLDPLMTKDVHTLEVSRKYLPMGRKSMGITNRPGSKALEAQVTTVEHKTVTVVEDDIFSGGSIGQAVLLLQEQGIEINSIVPGIQVGSMNELMGISINPLVRFSIESTDKDIFDFVDLGDPRDFLIGASGLVIEFPKVGKVRLPYLMPFVSTSARTGIPKEVEKQFSMTMLDASKAFYTKIQESTGYGIKVGDCDKYFVKYCTDILGFDPNTGMTDFISYVEQNYSTLEAHNLAFENILQ